MHRISLIPPTEGDWALIDRWLRREHVRRWWGDPETNLEQLKSWAPEDHALIEVDGTKVGLVCWSFPTRQELDEAGLDEVPTSVVDIDIMIGESESLGLGIGTRAIQLAVQKIFCNENVPAVMAGTSVENPASLRAFQKAGFRIKRQFHDPVGGPFLLLWTDEANLVCPFSAIRAAEPDDVPRLLPLMETFNNEEGIEWIPERTDSALQRLVKDHTLGFVIIVEAAQPVGYAVVTYNYDLEFGGRDAFITEIFVEAQLRGKGVAAALLHSVESRARRERVRALHLQVRPENRSAQRLYERFGYQKIPRETMTKLLETG